MLPILQLGPLSIQTYPLALMLAFWAALAVSAWAAARRGLDGDHLYNAGLYGLVAGVIAARLAHVLTYWPAYAAQPLEIIGLNLGAFLPGPGAVAAVAAAAWYVQRHRLPWPLVLDAAGPGALIGLAVASLGALLGGQSLGAPSTLPWAIELWGVARHPVQIYAALAYLAAAGAALGAVRRGARPGMAAWIAALGWGLAAWAFEPFRAASAVTLAGVRTWQAVGLVVALVALWRVRRA